jgi:hypothetical protein
MNTWMRRRIARSRERCEKAESGDKTKQRPQETNPQQTEQRASTPSS